MLSIDTPQILSADETRAVLPLPELIEAVGRSFAALPASAQRLVVADEGQDWVVMPGSPSRGGIICKLLRVGHGDAGASSAPTISGVVVLLDRDGRLIAIFDGATLTARRTAAVAAYATSLLARPEASVLAVFGAGALAEASVEAIAATRQLAKIRVVGRSPERLRTFCQRMSHQGYGVTAMDAHAAMQGADIVVAATTSSVPVFSDDDVEPGTHINAMGSYRAHRAEVPAATVVRARVIVETKASAWDEAGDLIQPRDSGLIDESHVWAELHERERIAALRAEDPEAITLFKSVGNAALDLAALEVALDRLEAAAV